LIVTAKVLKSFKKERRKVGERGRDKFLRKRREKNQMKTVNQTKKAKKMKECQMKRKKQSVR
jgi:hypothetical protein